MRQTKNLELMVGVFVFLGLASLVLLAFNISNLGNSFSSPSVYSVKAHFDNVGGLRTRAKVTMSGVNVGRVVSVAYDQKISRALVTMEIQSDYPLTTDTQASIYTAGLLGEQYISLEPGAEDEVLRDGDSIYLSQSALVLEEIVGKVLVNLTTK
ncbi:outer membrane lipid asymmetry maintenance protein MlaD [Leucothrix pacifica]|uniref:Outer membrane lipid asymmetry maintenance protein MlaD n=1 Tax=Leucothrix pacifica TaxID=1247513 RepID=A0A317CPN8_9GAMM|nr:outer membrane lipid asymmetry maintenance protein MlaD [Leucothrix pacifica]PWR00405.1 outer membrane lipid asymmetry maintenance protein MlaD [Leucothrix pacifica]